MESLDRINIALVKLFNMVLKLEERALKESSFRNLTINEIHTLEAISMDKSKTMSSIANELIISQSTLTSSVNRLVKMGYVDRFGVDDDRRIVKLQLTKNGREALKEHEAFHVAMVSEAIKTLSAEESDTLAETLDALVDFFGKFY